MSYFRTDRARRQPPQDRIRLDVRFKSDPYACRGPYRGSDLAETAHGGEKWGFVHIGFMVLTALALISFLVVLFTGGIFFVAGGE